MISVIQVYSRHHICIIVSVQCGMTAGKKIHHIKLTGAGSVIVYLFPAVKEVERSLIV